jgi:hypothetical protein
VNEVHCLTVVLYRKPLKATNELISASGINKSSHSLLNDSILNVSKKAKKKTQDKTNSTKENAQRSAKLTFCRKELFELVLTTSLSPLKYEFSTNGANTNARKYRNVLSK